MIEEKIEHASKTKRMPIQEVHMGDGKDYHFPFVWIQSETKIKNMSIIGLHRREHENPVATIQIDEKADIDNLIINDVSVHNHTNAELPIIVNNGNVKNLTSSNINKAGNNVI